MTKFKKYNVVEKYTKDIKAQLDNIGIWYPIKTIERICTMLYSSLDDQAFINHGLWSPGRTLSYKLSLKHQLTSIKALDIANNLTSQLLNKYIENKQFLLQEDFLKIRNACNLHHITKLDWRTMIMPVETRKYLWLMKWKESPGVYFLHEDYTLVYIGRSSNLKARIIDSAMSFENVNNIKVMKTKTISESMDLEKIMINKYRPLYNTEFKTAIPTEIISTIKVPRLSKMYYLGKVSKYNGAK